MRRRLRLVVERDVLQARRDRTVVGLAAAFVLFTAGAAYAQSATHGEYAPPLSTDETMFAAGALLSIALPLVVLVATYGTLLQERTSGSLRFSLGLPVSRRTIYLGKYVGRAAIVLGTLAVGFALATAVVLATYPTVHLGGYLLFAAATLLYAVVWVGVGLSISGAFGTVIRGTAGLVGVYLGFRLGWMGVQALGLHLADASRFRDTPDWYFLLGRLNPMNAYVRVTNELMVEPEQYHPLLSHPQGAGPVWATAGFALLVLVGWAVAAPVVGYVLFERADLE